MASTPLHPQPPGAGKVAVAFARGVVALRWWVVGFWVVVTISSIAVLPTLSQGRGGDGLKGLLSLDTPAVQTEIRSVDLFGFPLLARTVLVQRDPAGMSVYAQARTVTRALAVNDGRTADIGPLEGALPLTNTLGLFPASAEQNTTALTYLFFRPQVSLGAQTRTAQRYADRFFTERDDVVGVTGSVPARAQQGDIIRDSLPLVETATLAAIVLIVGLNFRSVVAPVVTLCTTGVAFVLTLRLSGAVAQLFGVTSPSELEPVVVALLLGVVTDYVVFFCAALRHELELGADRLPAAVTATARFGPIVAVAGLAVAAGTAALLVAESPFFRALGPALVATVLIGLAVAVTLVPALLAVLGRWVFWPTRPTTGSTDLPPESAVAGEHGSAPAEPPWSPVWVIAHRRGAALGVALACTVGLVLAALPVMNLRLGVSFVSGLPERATVRASAESAQAGFAPGILSPTVLLVESDGGGALSRAALSRLREQLGEQPGVAGVLGPGMQPLPVEAGVLTARGGDAARFLLVLDDEPLGAAAVDTADTLAEELPELLDDAGLEGVTAGLAGDSATAAYLVEQTESDLLRIGLAAMLANLLMLVLFLRALVAAVYLLIASLLSLAAALGLTTLLFGALDPGQGLTFYVPFAAAVLLLAFGSDYNIFGVGHVWDEARHRSLAEAMTTAIPRTTRAITAAGLALATSFGLLAVVALEPFRQLAFAMAAGIVLDVLVVRSLLMPSLLTLFGSWSAWPSRRLRLAAPRPGRSSRGTRLSPPR